MAAYLLSTLLLLNLIASGVYLLFRGLLILAKDHINERFRYLGCIAILLLFLIPFYQILPSASEGKIQVSAEAAASEYISVTEDSFLQDDFSTGDTAFPLSAGAQKMLVIFWLLGTSVLGFWYLFTFQHFRRKLCQGNPAPVCDELQQLAEQCARTCGVRQKPILRALPEIQGPMLVGFLRPIIAVPVDGLPLSGASLILTHELVHFKRRDLWWKLLGVVSRSIHWFNPIVWILGRELEFYAETACDAEVVQNLDHNARKHYGYLLISYIPSQHNRKPMLGISFTPARNKLQRRLSIMLNGNKSKKLITSAIVCVLAASSLTLSAFAAENQPRIPQVPSSNDSFSRQIQLDTPSAQAIDPNNAWGTENNSFDGRYCRRDGSMRNRRYLGRQGAGNFQRGCSNNNFCIFNNRT